MFRKILPQTRQIGHNIQHEELLLIYQKRLLQLGLPNWLLSRRCSQAERNGVKKNTEAARHF